MTTVKGGGGMMETGVDSVLVRMVNAQDVIAADVVWAMVVSGVRVVAPVVGVGDLGQCAGEPGLPVTGYAALPFVWLGLIAIL
ncbi:MULTISPECIES: hypothetical protein [unclassified Frankia]|uniref:hypothetical protein n=1 Tax=unclassified Frankia TaxID=2632575 RepID=UPI002AD36263|nr:MULTISPECIES: hypothetical protein [unclassified Frankia]